MLITSDELLQENIYSHNIVQTDGFIVAMMSHRAADANMHTSQVIVCAGLLWNALLLLIWIVD